MKIYFVRHGESISYTEKIHQDASCSLSELGKRQAMILAERFRTIPVDVILASPYERAQQTAYPLGRVMNKSIQTDVLLSELKRPSQIVGRRIDEPEVLKIKQDILAHIDDPEWRYSDEETFFDAKKRAQAFLAQLDSLVENNILVVTHGRFIHMMACVMMFDETLTPTHTQAFAKTFAISNTSITACVKEQGLRWQILQWNDDAHLGELK